MDPVLGMLIFSAGGLAGATFLLPSRWVKAWSYETWWFVYSLVGLVVCPPLICCFTVPDFWDVTMSAPSSTLLRCAGFGAIWVCQFACAKIGEPLMGSLKYISFAVVMASTIFFSTMIGMMLGEWKGVGGRTRFFLALGTVILVFSFCVISFGSR